MQKVKRAETELEQEQAYTVRRKVFVEEQGVPLHIELDEYDRSAVHFVGYDLEQPIAAGRLREVETGTGKVERVCVLSAFRGKHIGMLLMEEMEKHARETGLHTIILNAQSQALPFYEKLDYIITSPEFLDAGIPHRAMKKIIK